MTKNVEYWQGSNGPYVSVQDDDKAEAFAAAVGGVVEEEVTETEGHFDNDSTTRTENDPFKGFDLGKE